MIQKCLNNNRILKIVIHIVPIFYPFFSQHYIHISTAIQALDFMASIWSVEG